MENASKALLMAGSVLIAMLTISLFYFMFDRIGILVSNTDENTLEKEIVSFNKGFEAYNKKLMYGIDVISVLNKAIDNNKTYEATRDNENSEYYVNIVIELDEGFSKVVETYRKIEGNKGYEKVDDKSDEKEVLSSGSYSLDYNYDEEDTRDTINSLKSILIDVDTLVDEEGNEVTNNAKEVRDNTYVDGVLTEYTITYYPCAEFKRRTFTCTDVIYNDSGRVSKMVFKEY